MTSAKGKTILHTVGQAALQQDIAPHLPEPHVLSLSGSTSRRTVHEPGHTLEYYPHTYSTDGSTIENLRFAFKHEPLDLRIVHATMASIEPSKLEEWIRSEPTGTVSRRAWFFYEQLTGQTLDIEAVRTGNYVDALDTRRHYTADPINSPRYRVRDNLLGSAQLCPTVRRTLKLESMEKLGIAHEADAIATKYNRGILARAVNFLYTKETRSSFAIEHEIPSSRREARFFQALRNARRFLPTNKRGLMELQAAVVDPRYAAKDWRDFQNFVGETTRGFGEYVHFICPKPNDVDALMQGWQFLTERLRTSAVDAVVAAAVSSFAFVFVHPFEDGNGRVHRFLIHAMLSARGYGPKELVLPISAAMLRRRNLYDDALEAFSRPVLSCTDWEFDENNAIRVKNETADLFRFFDATEQAEYLYDCVAEAVQVDFKEEADFVNLFDAGLRAVRAVVDMPDQRASLLVRLCMQNGGTVSHSKRKLFDELTDAEFSQIEAAMQVVLSSHLS